MKRFKVPRLALLAGAAAFAALVVLIGALGARHILAQVAEALPWLPASLAVHAAQLLLAGLAWGTLLPVRLGAMQLLRARWVREAVNSILPTANVGGALAGGRVLTHEGIAAADAAASATVDVTGEALAQVLFLLCGLALAATDARAHLRWEYALATVLPLLAILVMFLGAQALGALGWVERLFNRFLPGRLEGSQARLADIYRAPRRLAANVALNFFSWSLGAAEVWVLLRGLHHTVTPGEAYSLESLGLVARSLAFLIPGGLAAQETGYALAAMLFGLPSAVGLSVSLLKRLRELAVGVSGVLYYQWMERRLWLAWGKSGQGAALDPLGPGAPDPHSSTRRLRRSRLDAPGLPGRRG